jgi:PKD repeat protein
LISIQEVAFRLHSVTKHILQEIKMKHFYSVLLCCGVFSLSAFAQTPVRENEQEKDEDNSSLQQMIEDRSFPGDNNNSFGRYSEEMNNYRNGSPQQLSANWNYVDASGNLNGDVGRTSSITIDTINSGRFYVCTPQSGVWMTNNNGVSYTPITESLPTQSTCRLVIDPTNTNVLYLATGAYNLDLPYNSMGIYKSIDGGATWTITGLSFSPSLAISIGDLIINPKNHNSLLASTSDGLYRTFNGGTTWTRILNTSTNSVRFKPGDTTLIYTVGNLYYRSSNSGSSFTQISNGIYDPFTYRYYFYVRTSAVVPNVVYLITSGLTSNPSFYARLYIHKSIDNGLTFSLVDSLSGVCQQIDVSQTHADKFIAGYYNTYEKANLSSPFQQLTQITASSTYPFMHTDQRGISFDPRNDSIIYFSNDGGLYRSPDNGISVQNITANMQLAHLYCLSNSQDTAYKILVSPLDVSPYIIGSAGIDRTFSTYYSEAFASDMSPVNDSVFFIGHGFPFFTTDDGQTFYGSSNPLTGNINDAKDFQYSDCEENVSYFGSWNDVLKSTDFAHSYFNFVHTTYNPVNNFIQSPKGIAVSRSNPDYIYVYYKDSVYVTTDGTSAFTNITSGLPVSSAIISNLVVDPLNENNVWISFSGYAAGNKIFYSSNAGQTWTNISSGLPNVPVNTMICQKGIPGAVYAGTDGGVFYIDNTFSSWQFYNTGIPNVMITGLDIQYEQQKIRASTFGRGVWESPLYVPTPANYIYPPVPLFTATTIHGCVGGAIQFFNTSCGDLDSLRWFFPGGIPSTSTSQAPFVTYSAGGNYSITLIVYNSGGSDTLTATNYISVAASVAYPFHEPVADLNQPVLPAGFWTTDVNHDGMMWTRDYFTDGSSGANDDFICFNNYGTDPLLIGVRERLYFPPVDLSGAHHPKLYFYRSYARHAVNINDTLQVHAQVCGGTDTLLFRKGGAQLANISGFYPNTFWVPNAPSQWVRDSVDLIGLAGNSSVIISFEDICDEGQLLYIDEFNLIETDPSAAIVDQTLQSGISVFPNPASNQLTIRSEGNELGNLIVTDISGRCVYTEKLNGTVATITVSAFSPGIYFLHINDAVFRIEKL